MAAARCDENMQNRNSGAAKAADAPASGFGLEEAPTKPFFTRMLGSPARPLPGRKVTIRRRVAEDAPTVSPPPLVEGGREGERDDMPKFVPKGTPIIVMPPDLAPPSVPGP